MSHRTFAGLLGALVVVLALQSAAHMWAVLYRARIDSWLDLDRSNGLPDLLSTLVVLAAVAGAAVLGSRQQGHRRRATLALAGVIALVALADALHLHPGRHSAPDDLTTLVAVAGVALLGAVIGDGSNGGRARTMIALGLVILGASLVLDALPELDEWFERARGDPIIEWQIVAKQGFEVAGWWLVAMGLWDAAGVAARASTPAGTP